MEDGVREIMTALPEAKDFEVSLLVLWSHSWKYHSVSGPFMPETTIDDFNSRTLALRVLSFSLPMFVIIQRRFQDRGEWVKLFHYEKSPVLTHVLTEFELSRNIEVSGDTVRFRFLC